jgi:hypothetical protein
MKGEGCMTHLCSAYSANALPSLHMTTFSNQHLHPRDMTAEEINRWNVPAFASNEALCSSNNFK